MTIYTIKDATIKKAPYFFVPDTLAFFHQTMEGFSIEKIQDVIYRISQLIKDREGNEMGTTIRFFYKDDLYSSLAEAIAARSIDLNEK